MAEVVDRAVDLFYRSFIAGNPTLTKDMIYRDFRPGPNQLRMEALAVTTSNTYTFKVQEGQNPTFLTEDRLDQQDIFVITEVGFYLCNPANADDVAFKDFTYVNPFFFNTAMQVFYHGKLFITVNNDEYTVGWPLKWHEHAPRTQQTLAAGANSPVDSFDGNCDGKRPQRPYLLMQGQKKNVPEIKLPVAATAVTANSRIALIFDGILFQNCTVVS